jgi:hypothetical protein
MDEQQFTLHERGDTTDSVPPCRGDHERGVHFRGDTVITGDTDVAFGSGDTRLQIVRQPIEDRHHHQQEHHPGGNSGDRDDTPQPPAAAWMAKVAPGQDERDDHHMRLEASTAGEKMTHTLTWAPGVELGKRSY